MMNSNNNIPILDESTDNDTNQRYSITSLIDDINYVFRAEFPDLTDLTTQNINTTDIIETNSPIIVGDIDNHYNQATSISNNELENTFVDEQQQQQHQDQLVNYYIDQPEFENNQLSGEAYYFDNNFSNNIGADNNSIIMANNNVSEQQNNFGFNINEPEVEIIEQPAKCSLRFRYKCETKGRSAGSLPGVNSTPENKTFPTIKISNYIGKAVVVISCVTKDEPFLCHPHNLIGKEGCKDKGGICSIKIDCETSETIRSFPSLGILCVKKKDIEESLKDREEVRVDPFVQGFEHKYNPNNIDLNVVRLCFQVFLEGSTAGKYDKILKPIVSDQIHDKKAMSDLVITDFVPSSTPVTGGKKVILLCDRISKDDIEIRFFEGKEENPKWETIVDVIPNSVHKSCAIVFESPKYINQNIIQKVSCRIQLRRISDRFAISEPRQFDFIPVECDDDIIIRKRKKCDALNNHNSRIFPPTNAIAAPTPQGPSTSSGVRQQQLPLSIRTNLRMPTQAIQQQPPLQRYNNQPMPGSSSNYYPQLQQQQQQQTNYFTRNQSEQIQHNLTPNASPSPSTLNNNSPNQYQFNQQQQQQPQISPPISTTQGRTSRQSGTSSPIRNNNDTQNNDNNCRVQGFRDAQGNMFQLVRPNLNHPSQLSDNSNTNTQLPTSLEGLNTNELFRGIEFNSNMDFNPK